MVLIPLKNPLATFSVSVWPQERPTGVIGGRSGPITAIAPARPPPNPRLRPGAPAGSQKNEAAAAGSGFPEPSSDIHLGSFRLPHRLTLRQCPQRQSQNPPHRLYP